jgi:hypothetical protein
VQLTNIDVNIAVVHLLETARVDVKCFLPDVATISAAGKRR